MRSHKFLNGEYYHVYCRGVDKRIIFCDDNDRERFVRSLFTHNDSDRIPNVPIRHHKCFGSPYVDIVAYCLMNNHFHLLLQQRIDRGVSSFLQRMLNGYTKYFNIRHERSGSLFESSFRCVPVQDEEQLLVNVRYIHTNPLSIFQPGWKTTGIRDPARSHVFLQNYAWSSYQHYLRQNENPLIHSDSVLRLLHGRAEYDISLKSFIETFTPKTEM